MTDKQVSKTTEALNLAEEALNAMLTHMGMDEDEWTKPTFNQAREALAAIREALADHSGGANEMVAEPVKQEPVAVISESAIGLVKLHSNGVSLPFGTQLYAAPVDAKAIREGRTKELMQLFLDPENQPTQFGTATLEYRQEEHKAIRAEALEEAAKVCDDMANNPMTGVLYSWKCAAAIRGLK